MVTLGTKLAIFEYDRNICTAPSITTCSQDGLSEYVTEFVTVYRLWATDYVRGVGSYSACNLCPKCDLPVEGKRIDIHWLMRLKCTSVTHGYISSGM